MLPVLDNLLLIGVDGGASEVKAHEILVLSTEDGLSLGLGAASASCLYDRIEGFAPAAIDEQLSAHRLQSVVVTSHERAQSELWVAAIASSIVSVAAQVDRQVARIGMCMPGIKTADARGVAVLRHGPRIPDLLDRVEHEVQRQGLELAQPISALISDGDACALGEQVEPHGLFRGVSNAYYIGGGTGLAEALKLGGELSSFDDRGEWLPKAWQLRAADGRTFEEIVSMGGINAAYSQRAGRLLPLHHDEFPEQLALRGDPIAIEVVREASTGLADLIFERLMALASSRPNSRAKPSGIELERIVLGQRLGRVYAEPALRRILRQRVEETLAQRIHAAGSVLAQASYLEGSSLRPGLIAASQMRAAPALGAAAFALKPRPRTSAGERGARKARG